MRPSADRLVVFFSCIAAMVVACGDPGGDGGGDVDAGIDTAGIDTAGIDTAGGDVADAADIDGADTGDDTNDADDADDDADPADADPTDADPTDADTGSGGDVDAGDVALPDTDVDADDAAVDGGLDADAATDVPVDTADAGSTPTRGVLWQVELVHGSFGSPRALPDADAPSFLLAYGNEIARSDTTEDQLGGSLARFDAATGERLSRYRTGEELFTVPVPMTDADGVTTWLVAGRNATLVRVDIRDDSAVWTFAPSGADARAVGLYNFFQPRLVDDITDDGVPEVLIPNGGDHLAAPSAPREPGFLLVLDGADGTLLHQLQMPDDQETYVGLTLWERPDGVHAVFGTGGETLVGHLWSAPLDDVLAGDFEGVERLVDGVFDRGFIAPPVYAQVDDDAWYDLIVYAFGGHIEALSGATGETLWSFTPPAYRESPASPALGDFDGDGDVDVFVSALRGIFPAWIGTTYRVYDARSGDMIWQSDDRVRRFAASASLSGDIDGDGLDEVLIGEVVVGGSEAATRTVFYAVHTDEARFEELFELPGFAGGAGWLGDIDLDGYLEFIASTAHVGRGHMARYNFDTPAVDIRWGGYFGSDHDGRY